MASSNTNTSNIAELLAELKINGQRNTDVSDTLSKISDQLANRELDKLVITQDIIDQFISILENEPRHREKVAEIIANLAKCELQRNAFTNANIIRSLIKVLGSVEISGCESKEIEANINLAKHSCRALGNLFYDNDECRKISRANNALNNLLRIVKESVKLGARKDISELRACAVSSILNLVSGYEDIDDNLKNELIDISSQVLRLGIQTNDDENSVLKCLYLIEFLKMTENSPILNEDLCKMLVPILQKSTSGELIEVCVELLNKQALNATVSFNIAKTGICQLFIQLLEEHKDLATDEDTMNLFEQACNLVILVLNFDDSMSLLFDKGRGEVFLNMVSWLTSNVLKLQISGALAIGNFARADDNCTEILNQGISKKILTILDKNNTEEGDPKLQCALLSALKNLAIADVNKAIIIKDGLLETLYPLVTVTSQMVLFKLIGTLRIVMDKQSLFAKELSKKSDLIKVVVDGCSSNHPKLQGESYRFLAWLVKNCKDKGVCDAVIKHNGVAKIVEMIPCDHEIMQNEALIAVAILSALVLVNIEKTFLDENIGEKIVVLIEKRKPSKEVVSNVLTVLRQLSKSANLRSHLCQCNVSSSIMKYMESNNIIGDLYEYATEVTKKIKEEVVE